MPPFEKITVEAKFKAAQKAPNGCWANVLSAMLGTRTVPNTNRKFDLSEEKIEEEATEKLGAGFMGFEARSVMEAGTLITGKLENTGLQTQTLVVNNLDTPEKTAALKDHIKNVVTYALQDHKSPVAFTDGSHYQMITGIDGDKLYIKDPKPDHQKVRNPKLNEEYEISIDEFLKGSPEHGINAGNGSIALTWMENEKIPDLERKQNRILDSFNNVLKNEVAGARELLGSNESLKSRKDRRDQYRKNLANSYESIKPSAENRKPSVPAKDSEKILGDLDALGKIAQQEAEEYIKAKRELDGFDNKLDKEKKYGDNLFTIPAQQEKWKKTWEKRENYAKTIQRKELAKRVDSLKKQLDDDRQLLNSYEEFRKNAEKKTDSLNSGSEQRGRNGLNLRTAKGRETDEKKKKAASEEEILRGKQRAVDAYKTAPVSHKPEKKPVPDKNITDLDTYSSLQRPAQEGLMALAGAYLSERAKTDIAKHPGRLYDYLKIDGHSLRELYGDDPNHLRSGAAAYMRLLTDSNTRLVHHTPKADPDKHTGSQLHVPIEKKGEVYEAAAGAYLAAAATVKLGIQKRRERLGYSELADLVQRTDAGKTGNRKVPRRRMSVEAGKAVKGLEDPGKTYLKRSKSIPGRSL